MPNPYLNCDVCKKLVDKYCSANCRIHIMCQVCAAVFRDGIADLPECPQCQGQAKITDRQDQQRAAICGTRKKENKVAFEDYEAGYKRGLVQDHQLFAEIEEQPDSIGSVDTTEVLPQPERNKPMPEFYYKIDPFTGKTFKHFPYKPKKKYRGEKSNDTAFTYKKLEFNIDNFVPTNYNIDHRTSFEQMIDKKKNGEKKSKAESHAASRYTSNGRDTTETSPQHSLIHCSKPTVQEPTIVATTIKPPAPKHKKLAAPHMIADLLRQSSSSESEANSGGDNDSGDILFADYAGETEERGAAALGEAQRGSDDHIRAVNRTSHASDHFEVQNPNVARRPSRDMSSCGGNADYLMLRDWDEEERCTSPIKGGRKPSASSWAPAPVLVKHQGNDEEEEEEIEGPGFDSDEDVRNEKQHIKNHFPGHEHFWS